MNILYAEVDTTKTMEDLILEGSRDVYFSPSVKLEAASGRCSISGESYLEEPYEFYKKIAEWFMAYTRSGGKGIYLDLRFSYFNTSSSRAILEMLRVLKNLQNSGTEVAVNWYYPNPDDDEILMEGEDFQEECGLAINMVEYELD
ncbi:DUF1987 domain-containing protein [Ohtaekwangia sp.]|uniref:DUF1987 domain-containing protein n=1 Tax=Ohtaekwangia sp. TaxID=2066019 RepID=UPI002F92C490